MYSTTFKQLAGSTLRILIALALTIAAVLMSAKPAAAHTWPVEYCGHGTDKHWSYNETWKRSFNDFGRHFHVYRVSAPWYLITPVDSFNDTRQC